MQKEKYEKCYEYLKEILNDLDVILCDNKYDDISIRLNMSLAPDLKILLAKLKKEEIKNIITSI